MMLAKGKASKRTRGKQKRSIKNHLIAKTIIIHNTKSRKTVAKPIFLVKEIKKIKIKRKTQTVT